MSYQFALGNIGSRSCQIQIEVYNTMLEKEGTEDEEEARRAYRVAREESDHAAEVVAGEKVSSALIEKVRNILFCV